MARSWEVGPSRIHGFGIFATAPIRKGEALGALDCRRFKREDFHAGVPVTGVTSGPNQLAVMGGFPLWYLNYARTGEEPNVFIMGTSDEDISPLVVAARDLHPGEELTLANALNMPL